MYKKSVLVLSLFAILGLVFARESTSQGPQAVSRPLETAPPPPVPLPVPLPEPTTRLVPIPAASQVPSNVAPKKLVNIWSMKIDQLDGRSVVLATIGKRDAIRITCDSLDYQTQKGMLQAQGRVEIASDDIRCSCDTLTIHLHENRLILESKAEVVLLKHKAPLGKVADKESHIQLSGDLISLRWPDLQIKSATKTDTETMTTTTTFSTNQESTRSEKK